jgi:hypothetical protein
MVLMTVPRRHWHPFATGVVTDIVVIGFGHHCTRRRWKKENARSKANKSVADPTPA